MKTRHPLNALLILAIGFVASVPRLSAQEHIVNGSFENTSNTFIADANGLMSLPAGSSAIPGWSTAITELAWVNNANPFGVVTPFGAFCLDLTGYHDLNPYSGVFQDIATTPGGNYRLSLALGAYAQVPGGGGQKKVLVTAGSSSTTFIHNSNLDSPAAKGNLWGTFTFNFTATAASTRVTILGIPEGNLYVGLDNVSVTRAGTTTPGTGEVVSMTLPNAFTAPQQFYRVQQLP